MEECSEANAGAEKASAQHSRKRTLKTLEQVLALEKLYNETQYPTQAMKLKLAEEIGLTAKQVHVWFCHRRCARATKATKEASVCQDRSSSVVQDRASGLKPDSYCSSQQEEGKISDPKEAGSQRSYSYTLDNKIQSPPKVAGGLSSTPTYSNSSSLKGRFVSHTENLYNLKTFKYQTGIEATKKTAHKPSGYLKVKIPVENLVLTAVKRQLGRRYRDDGPPLAVLFDSTPPGAFESRSNEHVGNEPVFISNFGQPNYVPHVGLANYHNTGPGYEVYNAKTIPHNLHLEDAKDKSGIPSGYQDKRSHWQLKKRSSVKPFRGQKNCMLDMYEDSPRETSLIDSKRTRPSRNNYEFVRRSDYLATCSNGLGNSMSPDAVIKAPYTGMVKINQGETKPVKDCSDSVRPYMHPRDEQTVELPSSFSENEMTESPSVD